MIFRTTSAPGAMKDTWAIWHAGVFYVYNMMVPRKGIFLSTSTDGVHFRERGMVIHSPKLGSGSVWRSPHVESDGLFQMSFTEREQGRLLTRFAESRDLITWHRLDPASDSRQDARWYKVGPEAGGYSGPRWDDLHTLPRPGGGLYGYLTATPLDGGASVGLAESPDGRRWQALPPPHIEWGGEPPLPWIEVGGTLKHAGRYWLAAKSETATHRGIWLLTADRPRGPWRPARGNYHLLTYDRRYAHNWYGGFFETPDGVLFNHSVRHPAPDEESHSHLAPFKRFAIDPQGTARLHWWTGNDALKGAFMGEAPLPVAAGTLVDPDHGAVIEGLLPLPAAGEPETGLVVGAAGGEALTVRFDATCRVWVAFEAGGPEPPIDRGRVFPNPAPFRLLLRRRFVEMYVGDVLIQSVTLPADATGALARLGPPADGNPPARCWTMAL